MKMTVLSQSAGLAFTWSTIVSVDVPGQPTVVGTYDAGAAASAVAAKDSLAYVAIADSQRALTIVTPGVNQEPVLRDINGDGTITIACLGDSNTAVNIMHKRTSWCTTIDALLKQRYPNSRTVNLAMAGTFAERIPINQSDAYTQLAQALAHRLDVLEQVILLDGVEHGEGRGAGDRVAAEGRAVIASLER